MKIACVLITHLPVKVELRRYPEIKTKPVIIAEEYGSQKLVLDSSPAARGVVTGMPLRRLCPAARMPSCCRRTGLFTRPLSGK